mmetsp:Transcript_3435/g.3927  ORF Transcript_3435/g.3927 Transcript_3435/m.3927 type:complete len:245 (-) Transcript_3435:120-854(-)
MTFVSKYLFLCVIFILRPAVSDVMSNAIGLTGRDFVMLVTDRGFRQGTQVIARDCDKIFQLGPHLMLAAVGDVANVDEFSSYLTCNLALSSMVSGIEMTTNGAAHFTRREVSRLLRRSPLQADLLIAGVDCRPAAVDGDEGDKGDEEESEGTATSSHPKGKSTVFPRLHWVDRTGAGCMLPYAAHGPSAPMVLATLDDLWHSDMSLDQCVSLTQTCITQLEKRGAVKSCGWQICVVDKDGFRDL